MPRSAPAVAFLLVMAFVASAPPVHGDELLTNNGFEQGIEPWEASQGELAPVSSPVRSGAGAARLSSAGLQLHEVYRWLAVAPGEPYLLSAWVLLDDPAIERVFLRIVWFDRQGGLVSQADSAWLTIRSTQYQLLTTGSVTSPLAAASARVGVRVQASSAFEVHFDDFSFSGAVPPPPTPPATPSATPVPTPALTPTAAPATRTPTPTPRPTATAEPDEEPGVFDSLTNGDFEFARADGTPYAWKDVGADLHTVAAPVAEGGRALAVVSRTTSTKWAYQTVRVRPGRYYEAAGYAWSGAGAETFLRVSWYRSGDGSGSAIDSVDSTEVAPPGDRFQRLTTGPIEAPAEALTAKVRLMLRPESAEETAAYFDAIVFGQTDARPHSGTESDDEASTGSRPESGGSRDTESDTRQETDGANERLVERYPLGFANVQPVPTPDPSAVGSGASGYDWLAAVAIAFGGASIAFAALLEWSQWRRKRAGGPQ